MQISPDGKTLAITTRTEEFEGVAILNRADLSPIAGRAFGRDFEIHGMTWASSEVLLIEPGIRLPGRTDFSFPTGEILALNTRSGKSKLIFGMRAGEDSTGTHLQVRDSERAAAEVIDVLPSSPHRVVIATQPFGGGVAEAHWLDVRTGRTVRVATAEYRRASFITNPAGEVVFRSQISNENEVEVDRRVGRGYQRAFTGGSLGGALEPLLPGPFPSSFFAYDDRDALTRGIALLDAHGSVHLLHRHPFADPDRLMTTRLRELIAVRYADSYPEYYYPDPDHPLAAAHRAASEHFPHLDATFTSVSDDGAFAIVRVEGDVQAAVYYLFDTRTKQMRRLLSERPWLKDAALAPMQPVEMRTSDGVRMIGFLTVPPGLQGQNLPLVVLVHGGPHGIKDRWGFNWEVQLLASAGFAVLQVNYRGSGGYGRFFEKAGYGEWGGRMQSDVTAATRWAVEEGIADPERICIFGTSYGAYSALTGAFQEPSLYRCAIGYAGVYDLPMMFSKGDVPTRVRGMNYLRAVLGDDPKALRARSPVYNAARIEAAVMLAHGGLDNRAPIDHARRMRAALKQAGKDVEWLVESREGHGFLNEANREALYRRVLEFLNNHIGSGQPARGKLEASE